MSEKDLNQVEMTPGSHGNDMSTGRHELNQAANVAQQDAAEVREKQTAEYVNTEGRQVSSRVGKVKRKSKKHSIAQAVSEYDIVETKPEPSKYLIEVNNLYKWFPIKGGVLRHVVNYVRAVDGFSCKIRRGTTLGLVGESGCGKTTVGRTMLNLYEPTRGTVYYNGNNILDLSRSQIRKLRPELQMIFQDPYSSLQPRMPVGEIIGEAVREHKIVSDEDYYDYINETLERCGLQSHHADRYPHEFSGGQRQRICIARSLALKPKFVVCDEPVSALDVSIQAQIINLLMDLQETEHLTYLFISHDLSVVQHISTDVGVMYLGNLVEIGPKEDIFAEPLHPYTKALFSAIPMPDPDIKMSREILQGDIPSPSNPPAGCKFHTRCPHCMEICKSVVPPMQEVRSGHRVACHLYKDALNLEGRPLTGGEIIAKRRMEQQKEA